MQRVPQVNLSNYKIIKAIGKGNFGKVSLIEDLKDGKQYAAKESIELISETNGINDFFLKEIISYSKTDNPAVLSLIGYSLLNFDKQPYTTMITEFISNGSLDTMLENERHGLASKEFTATIKYIILTGISLGMKYLHSIGIVHRDLKPANILLDNNLYLRICDFGCSFVSDEKLTKIQMNNEIGTPMYMAPEIFEGDFYSYKVDIYAFSLIVYEVITGKIPFQDYHSTFKLVNDVKNGKRPDLSLIKDENTLTFLEKCWSKDPSKRPTFNEIVDDFLNFKFIKVFGDVDIDEVNYYIEQFDDDLKNLIMKESLDFEKDNEKNECLMLIHALRLLKGLGIKKNIKEAVNILKQLSDKGNANAIFNYACLLRKGELIPADKKEAAQLFKIAADKGFVIAMYNYAWMNHTGDGIEINHKEAAKYYKMAADSNEYDDKSMLHYGLYAFNGVGVEKNEKEAAIYIKKAADLGNVSAICEYGYYLRFGKGVTINKKEAERYYQIAASQGDELAMFNYADMLMSGDGIPVNYKKAAKYYLMSANKGKANANFHYGMLLLQGLGVSKNQRDGIKYIKKAINKKHADSIFLYACMLYEGNLVRKNIKESVYYFKMASDLGEPKAMAQYGSMLLKGEGVAQNINEGLKFIKASADNGFDIAMYNYGLQLYNGILIPMNKKEAAYYYKMAADKGNAGASHNYGCMLLNGDGIPKNIKEAARYFKFAADHDDSESMFNYGKLLIGSDEIKRDVEGGLKYLRKAIEKGNVKGYYGIGLYYYCYEKNLKEAFKYFKMSADHGLALGFFMCGVVLHNENNNEYIKYLKMGANKGNLESIQMINAMKDSIPITNEEAMFYNSILKKNGIVEIKF